MSREDWIVDTRGTLKKCCVINDNRGADFQERMTCCVKYSQSCRNERAFGLLLYDQIMNTDSLVSHLTVV